MDGGFSAAHLPLGIDCPADLGVLADALVLRGWTDLEVQGFAWDNWACFFGFQEGESADDGPRTAARG